MAATWKRQTAPKHPNRVTNLQPAEGADFAAPSICCHALGSYRAGPHGQAQSRSAANASASPQPVPQPWTAQSPLSTKLSH